jgi:nitrate reductase alpha subunit
VALRTVDADDLLRPPARTATRATLADYNVVSTRMGWLPSAPHFNRNPLDLVAEAEKAGATDEAGVSKYMWSSSSSPARWMSPSPTRTTRSTGRAT